MKKLFNPTKAKLVKPGAIKQGGFTLIEAMIVLSMLGAATAIAVPYYQKQKERELVAATQEDIALIQQAVYSYHMENRTFPASLQELRDQEYYFGRMETPYGTPYQLAVNATNTAATVTFESPGKRVTESVANGLAQASPVNDETVQVSIGRPSKEAVLSTFLHRTEVAGCPECNTMETNINMNGNDIVGVQNLDAIDVNATSVVTETANVNTLGVRDSIAIGGAQINATADGMSIQSTQTEFSGDMLLNGDFVSNGGEMRGFANIQATSLEAQQVNSINVTTDNLTAVSATIDAATITNATGDSMTFNTAQFTSATTDQVNAATGVIGDLSGNTIKYGSGTFNSLNTTTLNSAIGTIDNLTGTSIAYSAADFGSVDVSGTTTTASLNTNLIAAQNANMVNVQTSGLVANTGRFQTYSAENLTFTGNLTVDGEVNAGTVSVDGALSANSLQASNSTLGAANASSMNVSGETRANSLVVSTNATVDSLTFGSAQGGNLKVDSVTGQSGVFSTLSAYSLSANDVTSSQSSINNNYSLIRTYKAQWDSCVAQGGCK